MIKYNIGLMLWHIKKVFNKKKMFYKLLMFIASTCKKSG